MSLLAQQAAFRAEIAADDDSAPPSSLGMEIYRNAYRGRLVSALEVSFERTRRWTGEDAFQAAARQYVLTRPPTSWTLDDYGADFPDLLSGLFVGDPEVAELAAMEWAMQRAFAALDTPTLDPAALAAAHAEADWDVMGFEMAAGYSLTPVRHDVIALWRALATLAPAAAAVEPLSREAHLLLWRADLTPHFRLLDAGEAQALDALAQGATLGALVEASEDGRLGEWLAGWFRDGVFAAGRLRR